MHPIQLPFSLLSFGWRLEIRRQRLLGTTTIRDMSELIGFYERMWADAARILSARMTEIDRGLWRIDRGSCSTLIHNYIVPIDDPVTLHIAGDKALCHRILMGEGLRIPEHEVYTLTSFGTAEAFLSRHPGSYFVVKPAAGTSGARGVTTHVASVAECRRASVLSALYCDRILIERWVPGESYRLLFLDGEMIHASRRRGHRVVGDGRSTIGHLLGDARLERGFAPADPAARDVLGTLESQGLRPDSVPEPGRDVLVRSASRPLGRRVEVRTVFDDEATPQIGPALRAQTAAAVKAIGSHFAGVDLITTDPSRPLEETGGVIIEINTTPGLHHHYNLIGGQSAVPPAVRVLTRLLCAAVESDRLPVSTSIRCARA